MTVLERVREYFTGCDVFTGKMFNVNYLPESAEKGVEYSIDPLPGDTIQRRYMDGSTVRQFTFAISSVNAYGQEVAEALKSSGALEAVADWLGAKNAARDYPDLGPHAQVHNMGVVTYPYLAQADATTSKYQMQCQITYYQLKG